MKKKKRKKENLNKKKAKYRHGKRCKRGHKS